MSKWLRRAVIVCGVLVLLALTGLIELVGVLRIQGKRVEFFRGKETSHKAAPQYLSDAAPETLFPKLTARGYTCGEQAPVPLLLRSCETRDDGGRRKIVVEGRYGGKPSRATATLARAPSSSEVKQWAADAVLTIPKDERPELEDWLREHIDTEGTTDTDSAAVKVQLTAQGVEANISARGGSIDLNVANPFKFSGAGAAKELAPTLVFDAAERFFPVSIDAYLADSDLCTFTIRHQKISFRQRKLGDRVRRYDCKRAPPLEKLPDGPPSCPSDDHDLCYWGLDLRDASETGAAEAYERQQARMRTQDRGRYTVYWNYAETEANRSVLQYWFFYPFNDFGNTHEGDWEAIVVETHSFLGMLLPQRAAYSSHDGGRSTKAGGRLPNGRLPGSYVYVAAGSHANYLSPGRAVVRVCAGDGAICVSSRDHSCGDGKTVKPTDYDLKPLPPAPAFFGSYGGANFLSGMAQVPNARPIPDPRIRSDWTRDPLAMFRRAAVEPKALSPC
jgi:hypothetical protein